MQIIDKAGVEEVKLNTLPCGTVFRIDGIVSMKIDNLNPMKDNMIQTINLKNGKITKIHAFKEVCPISAKLIIE